MQINRNHQILMEIVENYKKLKEVDSSKSSSSAALSNGIPPATSQVIGFWHPWQWCVHPETHKTTLKPSPLSMSSFVIW